MPSNELMKYVKESVVAGHSISKVRQAMLEAGWKSKEIDAAIQEAKKPASVREAERKQTAKQQLDLKLVLAAIAILLALAVVAYFLLFKR